MKAITRKWDALKASIRPHAAAVKAQALALDQKLLVLERPILIGGAALGAFICAYGSYLYATMVF